MSFTLWFDLRLQYKILNVSLYHVVCSLIMILCIFVHINGGNIPIIDYCDMLYDMLYLKLHSWFIITHLHVRCAHSYIAISTYIHPSCPQRVILSGSVAPSMLLSLHLNSPQIQVMINHECLSPRKGLWNGISPHDNHGESLLQVHHYLLNVIALCLANSHQNNHLT